MINGINLPEQIEAPIQQSRLNEKWIPEWNKMQEAFKSVHASVWSVQIDGMHPNSA
jgi:hypothetical protein